AYRNVQRARRGFALSTRARERLWEVFGQIRRRLDERKLQTVGDACDRVRERILREGTRPFLHVVVDEAQDLGPRELKLVAALAPNDPNALFFAGDVDQ